MTIGLQGLRSHVFSVCSSDEHCSEEQAVGNKILLWVC